MFRLWVICFLSLSLLGCATMKNTIDKSELQQGRRLFEGGYYKRAMRILMPLASKGIPQAEYAVGYMFYYGYGVPQDTELGFVWIEKAASTNYPPAVAARDLMIQDREDKKREEQQYKAKSERLQAEGIGPRI